MLLSSCGLIGTALRLAPYAMMFANESGKTTTTSKTLEVRGQEVQNKGGRGTLPAVGGTGAQLAFHR